MDEDSLGTSSRYVPRAPCIWAISGTGTS